MAVDPDSYLTNFLIRILHFRISNKTKTISSIGEDLHNFLADPDP